LQRPIDDVGLLSGKILGMNLITHQTGTEGKIVHKVLIEQGIFMLVKANQRSFTWVITHRSRGRNMILYSTEGGMDIEAVADKNTAIDFQGRGWSDVRYSGFPGTQDCF